MKPKELLNRKIGTIPPSGIRKFFDLANAMEGVISLGVGEPDFDTPWHIREEAIYAIEKGRTFYSANAGLPQLRQEICRYLKRRFHLEYQWESQIIVTVGGSEAIDLAFRAMLDPGDEVIVPEPSYVSYKPCAVLAGGVPRVLELREKDAFKLRPEDLERCINEKTKILLLCYPNNPTGAVMDREDLEPIAELVKKHDLFVVSDEIYSELNYTGRPHVSIATLPGMRERTIVINGFSKSYAMTGWRLGYTAGPRHIMDQMLKIHQYAIMCAPTTAQYAAVEALKNGDEDIEYMRREYDGRRRYLLKRFRDMGIGCFEAEGAFYVFPDISRYGLSSDEFAQRLLHEQKLAVVPGTAFGSSGEGHLRVSYAYSLNDLKRALDRIEAFVSGLGDS